MTHAYLFTGEILYMSTCTHNHIQHTHTRTRTHTRTQTHTHTHTHLNDTSIKAVGKGQIDFRLALLHGLRYLQLTGLRVWGLGVRD